MPGPRSRRSVALGLSAAVWPGAGQLYLRRHVLGVLLAASNLVLFVALIGVVIVGLAEAPEAASWTGRIVHAVARRRVLGLLALLGVVWGAGILDVVLRPPQDERRDSSQDNTVA